MTIEKDTLMLELADRCEKATGESFDLNHAIAAALGVASEPFTASLDAAMTLVPGDRDWFVERRGDGKFNAFVNGCGFLREGVATASLALCSAALRTRTSGEDR